MEYDDEAQEWLSLADERFQLVLPRAASAGCTPALIVSPLPLLGSVSCLLSAMPWVCFSQLSSNQWLNADQHRSLRTSELSTNTLENAECCTHMAKTVQVACVLCFCCLRSCFRDGALLQSPQSVTHWSVTTQTMPRMLKHLSNFAGGAEEPGARGRGSSSPAACQAVTVAAARCW